MPGFWPILWIQSAHEDWIPMQLKHEHQAVARGIWFVSHFFAHWASQKTHWHARNACQMCAILACLCVSWLKQRAKMCYKSWYLWPLPNNIAIQCLCQENQISPSVKPKHGMIFFLFLHGYWAFCKDGLSLWIFWFFLFCLIHLSTSSFQVQNLVLHQS